MTFHILVVDDDQFQLKATQVAIEKMLNYKVTTKDGGADAVEFLLSPQGASVDMVILDMQMPDVNGMDVLDRVCPNRPDLPIIMNTAHGDTKKAVEALKKGAVDFIEKKDGPDRMKVCIENAKLRCGLNKQVQKLHNFNRNKYDFVDIIGSSKSLKKAINLAGRACNSNIPVLISGESGVGKELFARAIHSNSERHKEPFVAVNCSAIPSNLVESTLFGHEKGSFTGAFERTLGKFREADGGTIFLDEVGELPLEIQSKLLRVLQNFEVEPVGAGKSTKVNVRVISATNKNLEEELTNKSFREDLFYRINVFPINVPPLRERKEDIPELLNHFIEKICAREGRQILSYDERLAEILSDYWWPGNIRQLENAIYRAIIMANGNKLALDDFESILKAISANYVYKDPMPKTKPTSKIGSIDEEISPFNRSNGKFKTMNEYERDIIEKVLHYHNSNISKVSKVLGIGRSTLYRKMKEYGLADGIVEDIDDYRKEVNE